MVLYLATFLYCSLKKKLSPFTHFHMGIGSTTWGWTIQFIHPLIWSTFAIQENIRSYMDDEVGDSRKSIILINQKNLWLIISLYRTNDQEITEKITELAFFLIQPFQSGRYLIQYCTLMITLYPKKYRGFIFTSFTLHFLIDYSFYSRNDIIM